MAGMLNSTWVLQHASVLAVCRDRPVRHIGHTMLCTFGSLSVCTGSNPVGKLFLLVTKQRQKEFVQSEMPGVTEQRSSERAGPIAVAAVAAAVGGGKQKAPKPQKHETPTPTRIVVKARAAPRDDQDQPMETTLLPSAVPALPAGQAEEPPQNVLRPIISPPGHKGQDRHGPSAQARGGRARPQAHQARGQQAPRAARGAHGAAPPRLVQRAAQNARASSTAQHKSTCAPAYFCLQSAQLFRRRCRGHKAK